MKAPSPPSPTPSRPAPPLQARDRYRPRDFGVGYGRSSGYASGRSYTAPPRAFSRYR